jgi:hypothetical protein
VVLIWRIIQNVLICSEIPTNTSCSGKRINRKYSGIGTNTGCSGTGTYIGYFVTETDTECSVIGTNTETNAKCSSVRTNAWDSDIGNNNNTELSCQARVVRRGRVLETMGCYLADYRARVGTWPARISRVSKTSRCTVQGNGHVVLCLETMVLSATTVAVLLVVGGV